MSVVVRVWKTSLKFRWWTSSPMPPMSIQGTPARCVTAVPASTVSVISPPQIALHPEPTALVASGAPMSGLLCVSNFCTTSFAPPSDLMPPAALMMSAAAIPPASSVALSGCCAPLKSVTLQMRTLLVELPLPPPPPAAAALPEPLLLALDEQAATSKAQVPPSATISCLLLKAISASCCWMPIWVTSGCSASEHNPRDVRHVRSVDRPGLSDTSSLHEDQGVRDLGDRGVLLGKQHAEAHFAAQRADGAEHLGDHDRSQSL